ncbi:MAG: hypothetical protein AAF771_01840 [Pseudomonadota bacterium]
MFKRLLVAALLLVQPMAAQAQASVSDVLGAIHLDPAFRQDLRDRGFTGERFEIMINHTRGLFTDADIIRGLERRISSELRARNYVTDDTFFARLDETLNQAYSVGLTQLRAGERQLLFQVDTGFVRAIPSRDCARMMSGRMTDDRYGKLFDAYLIKLTPEVLDAYYAATRKAMRLGLGPNPKARFLSAGEIRQVEEAIFPVVDSLISKQKNARALYDAWSNGDVSGRYSCAFSQMFSAAAMSLQGERRDLALRYLMSE